MQKLHFSIIIEASKEKVWETMLSDPTYRKWTEAFMPDSYFEGSWKQGEEMRFLGPGENGLEGMVSRIKENRPYQFISIEHLRSIKNEKEEAMEEWAGAHENYTLKEMDGKTELLIDTDTVDEYKDMFEKMWPKALAKLKELCEEKMPTITVSTTVDAPLQTVWECWTKPEHIINWCFASDDWEAPKAENNLRTGGKFKTRTSAKDGSAGFDFEGEYTNVKDFELIEYRILGGRKVKITFTKVPEGVKITESFEAENIYPEEKQREGWQSILDNFKKYTESQK